MMVSDVSASSAAIALSCGVNEVSTANYFLQRLGEVKRVGLACGEKRNVKDLASNTDYALIRKYSPRINCSLVHFTTSVTSKRVICTVEAF